MQQRLVMCHIFAVGIRLVSSLSCYTLHKHSKLRLASTELLLDRDRSCQIERTCISRAVFPLVICRQTRNIYKTEIIFQLDIGNWTLQTRRSSNYLRPGIAFHLSYRLAGRRVINEDSLETSKAFIKNVNNLQCCPVINVETISRVQLPSGSGFGGVFVDTFFVEVPHFRRD